MLGIPGQDTWVFFQGRWEAAGVLKLAWSNLFVKVHAFRLLHVNGLQGCTEGRIKSVRG